MPVATDDSGIAAFDMVCESLSSPNFERAVGASDNDVAFLSEVLNNNIMSGLIQAQDTLEAPRLEPVSCDNIENLTEILEKLDINAPVNPEAAELYDILADPHIKALIESHDDIAAKNYVTIGALPPVNIPPPLDALPIAATHTQMAPPESVRMVGIRKTPDEPLGITVKQDDHGNLAIARILSGSVIEKQGLLHVGDVIREINGHEISHPEEMHEVLSKQNGNITLKIVPHYLDDNASSQIFMKAHFNYDPQKDSLIPCRDAGLPFKEGDILQVLKMNEANWWQARKVDENGTSGLIPSQQLEEKRKAFVRPEYDYTHKSYLCGIVTKKKKKMMYKSNQSAQFDRQELMIYEEVARMPPFQRKSLVLVGAQGVGRRTLKQRLCKSDPSRFGSVVPHTSRPKREDEIDGDTYWFVSLEEMERAIFDSQFIEHGAYDGNYYGTKFDSVRHVIRSGKMCVLDITPEAVKVTKTSEFMPYVVFVAAPSVDIMRNMNFFALSRGFTNKQKTERDFRQCLEESERIEKDYKAYFDMVIVNDNMDESYNKLRRAIETLSTEPQWVPVSWVY